MNYDKIYYVWCTQKTFIYSDLHCPFLALMCKAAQLSEVETDQLDWSEMINPFLRFLRGRTMEHPEAAFCLASSFFISYIQSCKMQPRHRGCSQVIEKVSTLLIPVAHVSSCFIMFLCSVSFCCTKRSKQVMSCHVYTITVSWWITIYLDLHLCFAILL